MANQSNNDFPRLLCNLEHDQPGIHSEPNKSPVSAELFESFAAATGWKLGYKESRQSKARRQQPGLSDAPVTGKLSIHDMSADWPAGQPTAHRAKCGRLVAALDQLTDELQQTRLKLYATQAELATQIPVVVSQDESYLVAELLASLLNSAAESVGCSAAAIYLLDDDTEWLKMRSSVGLDGKHTQSNERLFATSVADIEAMCGHAIVVGDPTQGKIWHTPEQCNSAVCIPVASSTSILGTMWVFGDEIREYAAQEVNILEIIAGRIAAELEREAVIRHSLQVKTESKTETTRVECHPVINPPFDGWSMLGQMGWDGEKFIEWDVTEQEEIRLTIGTAFNGSTDGLSASVFVDSLTGEFQVHGRVEGVSFWMLDRESGVVHDIDEWAGPLFLTTSQSLIATTTDNPTIARKRLNNFENGRTHDGLVLYLNRV